jgi:hypothetical protein
MKLDCAATCDTHRKPITSITAVLLTFVTYLLTLPHMIKERVGDLSGIDREDQQFNLSKSAPKNLIKN